MKQIRPRLGALEMAVLEFLWQAGEANVRTAHGAVGKTRGLSLNTVQSTLERLYRKGLLAREKSGHAYVYRPEVTRADLVSRYIGEVIETFSSEREAPLLAAFVDLVERTDETTLRELEAMLAARKAGKGRGT